MYHLQLCQSKDHTFVLVKNRSLANHICVFYAYATKKHDGWVDESTASAIIWHDVAQL